MQEGLFQAENSISFSAAENTEAEVVTSAKDDVNQFQT